MAILGDRLFMGTLDAHLLAIDRYTGEVLWDVAWTIPRSATRSRARRSWSRTRSSSATPAVTLPTRGFLDAYDAATGKRVWRFYTIAGAG